MKAVPSKCHLCLRRRRSLSDDIATHSTSSHPPPSTNKSILSFLSCRIARDDYLPRQRTNQPNSSPKNPSLTSITNQCALPMFVDPMFSRLAVLILVRQCRNFRRLSWIWLLVLLDHGPTHLARLRATVHDQFPALQRRALIQPAHNLRSNMYSCVSPPRYLKFSQLMV